MRAIWKACAVGSRSLILAIETSGDACAALIRDGEHECARIVEQLGRGHAERIVPMCGEAVDAASVEWRALTDIAVAVGPGSFAGVRAGVAAARGFALSLGVRAHGVTTLEAIAGDAEVTGTSEIVAVLPGPRGQAFAQVFRGGPITDARFGAPAELARSLQWSEGAVFAGPGAPAFAEAVGATDRVARDASPDVGAIARLALARIARGEHRPAEPFYLRGADAKPGRAPLDRLRARPASEVA